MGETAPPSISPCGTALLLALGILLFGDVAIAALTVHEPVREAAAGALPFAALYVLLSFPAFQLDGIFIGATRTRAMRNASAFSVAIFLPAACWLMALIGVAGLWLAFIIYVVARAVGLACYYPALRGDLQSP